MAKTSLKISKFIIKLLEILKNQQYNQIIRWTLNGTGLQILDKKELHQNVLPLYFKLKKGTSFIRQLHLYGFSKKKSQQSKIIFEHPCFLKECSQNYHQIRRTYKDKSDNDRNQSENCLEKQISTEVKQWSSIQNIFFKDIFANWNLNRDEEVSFFIENMLI